jgi:hypothetical protein
MPGADFPVLHAAVSMTGGCTPHYQLGTLQMPSELSDGMLYVP